jgi:hypothetical protein
MFFNFLNIKNWPNFPPRKEQKLLNFTLGKSKKKGNPKNSQFLCPKNDKICQEQIY